VTACISAVQHLRPLRGGAQSHLLKASDGACYVTKFQNNPQHIRVLANEMLATNLGLVLGLPMPRVEVIEVSDWLIEHTEGLRIDLGGSKIPCRSGKQLGSLYVGCESPGMTFDYLPRELLQRVVNVGDFARVLVLDKWTCNSDGRQAIFCRKSAERPAIRRNLHRPGLLFQCQRVEFPGLSAPRRIREQLCIRECHGMEVIRTSPDQSRRDGCGHHLAVCGRGSGRVVRRRSRRPESVGRGAAPSPWGDSEVDRRISKVEPEPISELA
jgi:hypothetical protein